MKYFLSILLTACLGLSITLGQNNAAELVDQRFNNDEVLQIFYQVKEKNTYSVSLKTNNPEIQPTTDNVQGLGTVTASGIGYESVTWYFGDDGYSRAQVEALNLTVLAIPTGQGVQPAPIVREEKPPKVKERRGSNGLTFVGLGAIGAGAGLGVAGFLQYGTAQEIYKTYSEDLYPNSSTYQAKPRDQWLEDANSTYQNAQIMWIAGGGLAVVGGILMIASGRKNSSYGGRVQLQPWENLAQIEIPENPVGMGIKIRL